MSGFGSPVDHTRAKEHSTRVKKSIKNVTKCRDSGSAKSRETR